MAKEGIFYRRILEAFATVPSELTKFEHLENELSDLIRNKMAHVALQFPESYEGLQFLIKILELPPVLKESGAIYEKKPERKTGTNG